MMDTRETTVTKPAEATVPQTAVRDISTLAMCKTFLTKEEIVLAHTSILCLLLPTNGEDTWDPSDVFLKGSVWHKYALK